MTPTQFRTLEEIGAIYSGLTGKSKADFADGDTRFVTYMNVFNNMATNVSPSDTVRVRADERQNRVRYGDVLFTASSENAEEVGMSSAVTAEPPEPLYLNSFCFGFRPNAEVELNPQFAKHLFRSTGVRRQIIRTANGVTRINISKRRFRGVRIPVPPLEVQREIVKVLDTFTELETDLEAELEARQRQYEHYRRQIVRGIRAEGVRLGDLGRWFGGMTPSKADPRYWDGGQIPWLASMDVSDPAASEIRGRVTPVALAETSLRLIPPPSVAVVMRSNILRRRLPVGLITVETTLNQDMRVLVPRDGIEAEFVYQVLSARSEALRAACVRTDGSMAAVDSKRFFAVEVPLPSLEEQTRIAGELRKFDTLVNDLSIGLPAELKARRKQYEHYRDRLLTFQEAT